MKKLLLGLVIAGLILGVGRAYAMDPLGPLILAAFQGSNDLVQEVLDQGEDVNVCWGVHNETALMAAASTGKDDTVSLLLDRGADVEVKNNRNESAIHYAVNHNHFNTVVLLLSRGACCDYRVGLAHYSLLDTAAFKGNLDMINLLLYVGGYDLKGHLMPYFVAIDAGDKELLAVLFLHYSPLPNELDELVEHIQILERRCLRDPDIKAICTDFQSYMKDHPAFSHSVKEKIMAVRNNPRVHEAMRSIALRPIKEKHGSVINYLRNRELGLTKFNRELGLGK